MLRLGSCRGLRSKWSFCLFELPCTTGRCKLGGDGIRPGEKGKHAVSTGLDRCDCRGDLALYGRRLCRGTSSGWIAVPGGGVAGNGAVWSVNPTSGSVCPVWGCESPVVALFCFQSLPGKRANARSQEPSFLNRSWGNNGHETKKNLLVCGFCFCSRCLRDRGWMSWVETVWTDLVMVGRIPPSGPHGGSSQSERLPKPK
jgi:hypothetical protein